MGVKLSLLQNIILTCTCYKNCHISIIQTSLLSCPRASAVAVTGCAGRFMQTLYASYRKQACRHHDRDTRRSSNLNDIFTCRGTESSQTLLPTAVSLLHISNPSSDMLIILRGKTRPHLACKVQRFIFQVTCAVVHGLRCSAARRERRLV